MEQVGDSLLLAATDLLNSLECRHLTWLESERARGELSAEPVRPETAELVAAKGGEHEASYLQALKAQHGDGVVEIVSQGGDQALERAVARTIDAMETGAPVIFQASFQSGHWRGHADFLRRVERASRLGAWSYEPIDTKLARSVKPYFVLQLCFYSELLAAVQGVEPEQMHLVLGNEEERSLRFADFSAYYGRLKTEFAAAAASGFADVYPEPVPHCGLCRWSHLCDAKWTADDHLSLVARMTRAQQARLTQAAIVTVRDLGRATPELRPPRIGEHTFDRLRHQARLQVTQRDSGEPRYELLEPHLDPDAPPRGFAQLPRPSDGDLFFDIEGDPFYGERGLEYLWGVSYSEDGVERYLAFWGREPSDEKRAFEAFIDFVVERRARFPDMHVYHYAPYEPTAMKRLMAVHGTREDEVDRLLRGGVLIDLYRVVEQALRISQPSYSLKKVEVFYMPDREASVTDGEDSILKFEEWLATGDESLLGWIERYNEEDCVSTLRLLRWLLELRTECERQYSTRIPWLPGGGWLPATEPEKEDAVTARIRSELLSGISDDRSLRTNDEQGRWLAAQLLDYHRRERKPFWWEYFTRLGLTDQELTETDSETLGELKVSDLAPRTDVQSLIHTLRFPPQEHKIAPGAYADPLSATIDPVTGHPDPFSVTKFNVERVIDGEGLVEIRRKAAWRDRPLPRALIPCTTYDTGEHERALREVASATLSYGFGGDGPHRAARDLIARAPVRTAAIPPGQPLQEGSADLELTKAVVRGLDHSYLFIQGPPGSGKTYTGAHIILDLLANGMRVGVASNSHKAINNLLREVEEYAGDAAFRGLKKSNTADQRFDSSRASPLIGNSNTNADFSVVPGVDLMAGTAWLWSREDMRESVDYLVVDEAGQISLADAVAMGTAGQNVVLLGDPLQLAQVSQGAHPDGSGASVLAHVLGDAETIPPTRGIFLDHTRRMHPDVCRFVSEAVYQGRLSSIDECKKPTDRRRRSAHRDGLADDHDRPQRQHASLVRGGRPYRRRG